MKTRTSTYNAPIPTQSVFSRPAALIAGGVGVLTLSAIAATFALRPLALPPTDMRASAAPTTLVAQAGPAPEKVGVVADKSALPKPVHVQRGNVTAAAPGRVAASVCANCGRVESVGPVQQKGEGTGLGAVGGAVVGGLLGHQVGGGNGKKVATVLGAVGGGVAGNEVEKQARATTVYQVRVRMDDGSLRTVTQGSAPAVGQKVTVEGSTLRVRSAAS